jgi:hypothetical protein
VKTEGQKLSNEWVEGFANEYGGTIKKQQSSREKLSCHKLSAACIKACEYWLLLIKNGNTEHKITSSAVHNNMPLVLNCLPNCKTESSHDRLAAFIGHQGANGLEIHLRCIL